MNDGQTQTDFKILYDGSWLHEGEPIGRKALAKLFSDRALKRDEEGCYWLQTPFEKYPVEVEDVPFVIVDYTECEGGIDLRTNMDEIVKMGRETLWEIRDEVPYVEVRDGLFARLSRSVFYNLVEAYGAEIKSRGIVFPLGDAA